MKLCTVCLVTVTFKTVQPVAMQFVYAVHVDCCQEDVASAVCL